MESTQIDKHAKLKRHIEQNAMKFDLPTLLKNLARIGYSSSDILYLPTEAMCSQESYIDKVIFRSGNVEIYVNEINAAIFSDYLKSNLPYRPKLQYFFRGLISRLLNDYNTSLCPEYRNELKDGYCEGDALVALHDGNLKSYSFVHNYLELLFSDYQTLVFKKNEPINNPYPQLGLGEITLDPDSVLGGMKMETKEFIVIRVITENMVTNAETKDMLSRIKYFHKDFKDILAEINIILENMITDDDLYTKLPHTFDDNSYLLQGVVRLLRSHTVNHYGSQNE
ncbi:MAG: hypothetical protein GY750_05715 [Lentisphaerae bacterium]|nr:hypothetical protein [Lentisphaerota bacterium]MCP4100906.1 hypothetical protein [Lentisphaerota bacterium]